MEKLEAAYNAVDAELSYLKKKPTSYRSQQLFRIQTELWNLIRQRSLRERLTPDKYNKRIRKALELVDNIKSSLNDTKLGFDDEQVIWFHQPKDILAGMQREAEPCIYGDDLERAVATYLANPWMQHNPIDWILLDSMIYRGLVDFREGVLSGTLLGEFNWKYILSGRNPFKELLIG